MQAHNRNVGGLHVAAGEGAQVPDWDEGPLQGDAGGGPGTGGGGSQDLGQQAQVRAGFGHNFSWDLGFGRTSPLTIGRV